MCCATFVLYCVCVVLCVVLHLCCTVFVLCCICVVLCLLHRAVCRPRGLSFTWWDVVVYVSDINQLSMPTPFPPFCSCVCFCLYGPFNRSSVHKFSRQFSAFSGLAVRRLAGKRKNLGSIRFGSPFSSLQKLWFMDTVL